MYALTRHLFAAVHSTLKFPVLNNTSSKLHGVGLLNKCCKISVQFGPVEMLLVKDFNRFLNDI